MKKLISLLLAITMCFSFSACTTKKEKAYNLSQEAFFEISEAFDIMEQISSDIISAWTVGIYESTHIKYAYGDGFETFCNSVSLSKEDIFDGLGYYAYLKDDFQYKNLDSYKSSARNNYNTYFCSYYSKCGIIYDYDEVFMGCIMLVVYSYEQNGKLGEIEQLLTSAEEKIKELSDKYSDYEHYDNIKEYYSTARTMYSFCKSPTGTLEQANNNTNNYKNTADACYNNLYYFFQ